MVDTKFYLSFSLILARRN